jgi:hypothetical protein
VRACLSVIAVALLPGCIDFDTDFATYCSVTGRCGDAGTGGGASFGGGGGGTSGQGGGTSSTGGGVGTGGGTATGGGSADGGIQTTTDGGCIGPLCLISMTTIPHMNHAHLWSPSKTSSSAGVWVSGDTYPADVGQVVHFDGHMWKPVTLPMTRTLNDIDGTADNDVYVVGKSGDVLHFDGGTWDVVGTATSTLIPELTGIVVSPQRWAVADFEGVIMSGTPAWTTTMMLGPAQTLEDVAATQNMAIAVGIDSFATDTSLVFENSGSGWNNIDVKVSQQLNAVFLLSDTEAFAVGEQTMILHRTSAGWAQEVPSTDNEYFTSAWGTSATDMWVGGWGGVLYHRNAANLWDNFHTGDLNIFFSVSDILGFGTSELWVAGDNNNDTVVCAFQVR